MNIQVAKKSLDKVIYKARVHFYKPIHIAEILYHDRIEKDITLSDISTYRTRSREWRDRVCIKFVGRTSGSSSRYQDDLFNDNAVPPEILAELGQENRKKNGIVEAYIYQKFARRFSKMTTGFEYCLKHDKSSFDLNAFLNIFWNEPGLRRSIDKIYEIVVYSLFSALVEALEISVEVSVNPAHYDLLEEFQDFAIRILRLSARLTSFKVKARINRVGVTNAADRGLDMWANFGLAIQIKHLSLTEELAENIVSSISADRIVIVCKDTEQKIIVSLLNQMGWKSRIQSIVTETDLLAWYEKALRGRFSEAIGNKLLQKLIDELRVEFPVADSTEFMTFIRQRGYDGLSDEDWTY